MRWIFAAVAAVCLFVVPSVASATHGIGGQTVVFDQFGRPIVIQNGFFHSSGFSLRRGPVLRQNRFVPRRVLVPRGVPVQRGPRININIDD